MPCVALRHALVATPSAFPVEPLYHASLAADPPGRSTRGVPALAERLEKRVPDNVDDELILDSLNDEDLVLQVHDDLYNGLRAEVIEATNILLARGWSADRVLNDALVEGMRIVGIDFRDGILFVPEVLLAANSMKGGMEILRPLLAETGVEPIGKMVIGTVKGDIHDIGKNLVSMMMEGAGFEVIDLGINNPVEKYLAALAEHKPDILGLSALLTTTMPYMKVVIDTLKDQGIRDDYIVLVGGAPLNEAFGKAVGADAYCRDAAIAVETAKSLIAARRAARVPSCWAGGPEPGGTADPHVLARHSLAGRRQTGSRHRSQAIVAALSGSRRPRRYARRQGQFRCLSRGLEAQRAARVRR